MDTALGWIGQIAAWIGQFFPRWATLHPATAALKVIGWSFRPSRRACRVVVQRSGIVWWWPVVTALNIHPVVRQANNLPTQTIVTTDHKTYIIGCMIVYDVTDIEQLLTNTWDADDTVKDIAATAAHAAAGSYSEEELLTVARSGQLDKEMKSIAHAQLRNYGVRVVKMQLTDLAPCHVLRLMNSEPTDVGKVFGG